MKEWLAYAVVWSVLKFTGALPRPLARAMGAGIARALFALLPKLRKIAAFNLRLAFPEWTDAQRDTTLRGMVRSLGWMAAEFARMPRYARENIEEVIVLDGNENFLEGQRRGKGVLFLTAHMGAWELSSYAHALYGYPLHYMARPLDNARLDGLVNRYRGLSGNVPIYKNESARAMLRILREAGTVGILADQNTLPEEGAFVDFFGTPACTTTGCVAHRSGSSAGLRSVGRSAEKIPAAIRTAAGVDSDRRRRARYFRKYPAFREGDRGDYSKISGTVGVGTRALENAAKRRAGALRFLVRNVLGNYCEALAWEAR